MTSHEQVPTLDRGPARHVGYTPRWHRWSYAMHTRHTFLVVLIAFGCLAGLVALGDPTSAYADTYTVTTTEDSGTGSLRAAILAANNHPNNVPPGSAPIRDQISFNIQSGNCHSVSGSTICTIVPTSALPAITDPVIVNGLSQGGSAYNSRPLIELSGTSAGALVDGLTITAGNSEVYGLIINRFQGNGLVLASNGNNVVDGNFLGVDAAGTTAAGNLLAGLSITGAGSNHIGIGTTAYPNVISGNRVGVSIAGGSNDNNIGRNVIGTTPDGANPIGNASFGIVIFSGSGNRIGYSVDIGGTPILQDNVIADNHGPGIGISAGSGNTVWGNRIHDNDGLGIDLGNTGVTPNDPLDADVGPNGLQNAPIIQTARTTGATTTISGVLNSAPNTTYNLLFYQSPSCDPSGYGEGASLIPGPMSNPVTTNATGTGTFAFSVSALAPGISVTATAGAPSSKLFLYDTSEFSACQTVAQPAIVVKPTSPLVTTEAGGTATATAVLAAPPTADVLVQLVSTNPREGTAAAPGSVLPGVLTFTPDTWSTPQTITVTGVDDQLADGDVAYTIQIGPAISADPGYDGLDPADLSLTNRDDEPTPALSIADASLAEGDAGTSTAGFIVTLAPPSRQTITVQYTTADGTASTPGDYTATTGTLTFLPSDTSKTIFVDVVGDTSVEPDETFGVTLSSPVNATLARSTAVGTIRNDDVGSPPPSTSTPTLTRP
jgi:hypothetical protein